MVFFDDCVERLRANPATRALVERDDFDADDTLSVDRVACALLKAISADGDEEAFQLLVDLTEPLLEVAAQDILIEEGLASTTASLVDAVYTDVYVGGIGSTREERHFLARATDDLRILASHHVRDLRDGRAAHPPPLAIAAAGARDVPEHERFAQELLATISRAFHGLALLERQLILGRGVYDRSEAEVAEITGVPLEDVEPRLADAWDALNAAKEALLSDDDPPGDGAHR